MTILNNFFIYSVQKNEIENALDENSKQHIFDILHFVSFNDVKFYTNQTTLSCKNRQDINFYIPSICLNHQSIKDYITGKSKKNNYEDMTIFEKVVKITLLDKLVENFPYGYDSYIYGDYGHSVINGQRTNCITYFLHKINDKNYCGPEIYGEKISAIYVFNRKDIAQINLAMNLYHLLSGKSQVCVLSMIFSVIANQDIIYEYQNYNYKYMDEAKKIYQNLEQLLTETNNKLNIIVHEEQGFMEQLSQHNKYFKHQITLEYGQYEKEDSVYGSEYQKVSQDNFIIK